MAPALSVGISRSAGALSSEDVKTPPEPTAGVSGTQSRSPERPSAAPLAKIGMALFALGVVAIAMDLVLFASGSRDLPLWLNLLCLLAPIGLGVGLYGVFRDARSSGRRSAQRRAARTQ